MSTKPGQPQLTHIKSTRIENGSMDIERMIVLEGMIRTVPARLQVNRPSLAGVPVSVACNPTKLHI